LPFNTSRLGEVPGMRLVWQGGGYWLYRIAPLEGS
jgi:hydroxylamine oxidation protein HaoB